MTTGGESFVMSIWVIVEFVVLLFTWILWRHAMQVQRRKAKRSREAARQAAASAQAAGPGQATGFRIAEAPRDVA
jgi:flagellar biosynthesis/type III secretory pathway M-ring protein FliF/YscJ